MRKKQENCELWKQVSSSKQKEEEASLKEAGTEVDWQIIAPIIAGEQQAGLFPKRMNIWKFQTAFDPPPSLFWTQILQCNAITFLRSGCSRPDCFADSPHSLLSQKEVQVYLINIACNAENLTFFFVSYKLYNKQS